MDDAFVRDDDDLLDEDGVVDDVRRTSSAVFDKDFPLEISDETDDGVFDRFVFDGFVDDDAKNDGNEINSTVICRKCPAAKSVK